MNKFIIAAIIILIILIVRYTVQVKYMCDLNIVNWNDIKNKLNTGDIFLTRYDHMHDLNIIKYVFANVLYSYTGGMYTHAAVVIKLNGKPYIYTAMDSAKYDLITQSYKSGSMLIDIEEYLLTYDGNFVLYKIVQPIEDLDDFNTFAIENRAKEFDSSLITMMNTIFGFWKNKMDDKTMCSQAVADALQALKIMPSNVYTPNIGPTDILKFAKSDKYNNPVLINNNYAKNQCSK